MGDVLREHGVCVIAEMFPQADVQPWGQAVSADMDEIMDAARRNYGVDFLSNGGIQDEESLRRNFHEVSTREALRFDIRGGKRMAALSESAATAEAASGAEGSSNAPAASVPAPTPLPFGRNPSLVAIVKDLFNPPSQHSDGTWGRHNFQGGGTGVQPEPSISQGGAVVSDPGSSSQKIHADTPHLYEDRHCAPHYINLFLPVVDDPSDLTVGQTGFLWAPTGSSDARLVAAAKKPPEGIQVAARASARANRRLHSV